MRTKSACRLHRHPSYPGIVPRGVPLHLRSVISLSVAEWEAIRLVDYETCSQADAARLMGVSQPTFFRILRRGRTKLAKMVIEGLALDFVK